MDSSPTEPEKDEDLDSLESSSTVIEPSVTRDNASADSENPGSAQNNVKPDRSPPGYNKYIERLLRHFNVYSLLFILVLIIAGAAIVVSYLYNKSSNDTNKPVTSQTLSQDALNQLANSDVTVGDAKQVLNVQSNAVFAGKVLVRDTLEVAGGLQVGGSLTLTGIKVAGTSVFDTVQITKDLAVSGNTSLQGQLTVQKSLNVNGGGSFNGPLSASQITTGSLQLSGDLNLTHHITGGGATPSRSNGPALGGGGTASVSGSDTAGSITINTGGGPAAGCFITINFVNKFNATPHIVVTPVGSAAGGLAYYINRSTSNFSVCTTSTPPAGANFGFDYIAFD
jgi:cytoskeletal protein CcmA (bactofilin family)